MNPQKAALDQIAKWNAMPDNPGWERAFASKPKPKSKPKKKKPWYSALISEGGAAGGAIGGAAAGTAILPGIGTLAGALIGGFAGGAGGSAVEQKVRDNKVNWKKAGLEGAISGVLMPGPLKLAKAGGTAIKAGATGRPVIQAVNQTLARGGRFKTPVAKISEMGERAETRAANTHIGASARGRPGTVGPKEMKRFQQLDIDEKIRAGLPDRQAKDAYKALKSVGAEMNETLKTANRSITALEKDKLRLGLNRAVKRDISIANDPNVAKVLNQISKGFGGIKSLKGAVNQKQFLQNRVSYLRNSQSAVPGGEEAHRIAIKVLDEFINKNSALKPLNTRWSLLKDRGELAKQAASYGAQNSRRADVGLVGSLKSGDIATSLKSRVGRGGRRLGDLPGLRVAANTAGGSRTPVGYGARAVVGSGLAQSIIPGQEQPPEPIPEENLMGELPPEGMETGMEAPAQSPYPLERALADIQRDPKHASTYLSIYKTVSDATEAQGGGGKLDATSKRQVSNVEAAENIVDSIERIFSSTGGAQGLKGYITQQTSRVPRLGSKENAFRSMREGYLARIVRALGEVGTLNEGDIRRAVQLIPNFSDTPQSAQIKLAELRNNLRGYKQSIYQQGGGGNSSNDLSETLMQLQGAY